jgi:hypothetical protein
MASLQVSHGLKGGKNISRKVGQPFDFIEGELVFSSLRTWVGGEGSVGCQAQSRRVGRLQCWPTAMVRATREQDTSTMYRAIYILILGRKGESSEEGS